MRQVALFFLSCFVLSCTPKGEGIFINSTEHVVSVKLFDTVVVSQQQSFIVAPGEDLKIEGTGAVNAISIQNQDGGNAFSRILDLPDQSNEYARAGEHKICFLISEDEVYRVPLKYRDNWKSNLSNIMKEKNALVPLKRKDRG